MSMIYGGPRIRYHSTLLHRARKTAQESNGASDLSNHLIRMGHFFLNSISNFERFIKVYPLKSSDRVPVRLGECFLDIFRKRPDSRKLRPF